MNNHPEWRFPSAGKARRGGKEGKGFVGTGEGQQADQALSM